MSNLVRHNRAASSSRRGTCVFALLLVLSTACNSIMNAWLDPTVLGNFSQTATMELRTSLTLEDTPFGIPGAVNPSPEDLEVRPVEYPISPGDTLAIEIYELRQRQLPYQVQAAVSTTGYVNLAVVGRVDAAGLTVPELELAIKNTLQEKDILRDPEVTVNPVFLQNATYSIFGIGVSAANNAPLRAGTFPIQRPDLHILEAINQVGGLNEFISDVYVFRYDVPPWLSLRDTPSPAWGAADFSPRGSPRRLKPAAREDYGRVAAGDAGMSVRSLEDELIDAVVMGGQDNHETKPQPPVDEIPEALEPDPTQPFLWVNNEFVPNPAYTPPSGEGVASPPGMPAFDTAAPAVNWARIAGDTAYRVIRIAADLLRLGDPEVNIVVRAGDVIRIVSGEIGVYYMMGQVNRVGAFAFNAEPITLKAAIAAAGGLSSLAWPDRCTVYRRIGQREQMIQVNLDGIFAGTDPDFLIKRGDIINVGTHPFAPFLQSIRGFTIPNPITNIGYSFTYARNFADIDSFAIQSNPRNVRRVRQDFAFPKLVE